MLAYVVQAWLCVPALFLCSRHTALDIFVLKILGGNSMNNNFVKYKDLLTIKEYDKISNEEDFVFLPTEDEYLVGKYQDKCNMSQYGNQIPIRKSVFYKLMEAAKKLKSIKNTYKLMVVYGFRAMEMQEKYFYEIYDEVKDKFEDKMEMFEYIHEKIAVPEVAGHPTGGAVDIAIFDEEVGMIIEFGSQILDWDTEKCYYNNDEISEEAKKNRKMLRTVMMNEGFAPYDGEWWHFSYGDKEWAFYYKKSRALYNQENSERVYKDMK